jgi:hypothetical protein
MRRIGYILTAVISLTGAGAYISLAPAHADGAATPVFDVNQMPASYRDWKVVSVAHEAGNLNDLRAVLGVDFSNFCPILQQFLSNSPCAVRFSSLPRHRSTESGDILAAIPPDVAPATGGLREPNPQGGRLADLGE